MKKLALALPLTLLLSGVAVPVSAADVSPSQQFQAFVASAPETTTFVIPPQMSVEPPLHVDEVLPGTAYWPYVNDIQVTRNNTVGIFGSILTGVGQNTGGGANMSTPTPNLSRPQPQWETDKYTINSCGEWVYKKYHDYQWFQSAAASCGGNGDCVYGVWASTTAPGEDRMMGALSQIQSGQMSPYPSSALDPILGAPPDGQPSSTQPKNPFMSASNQSVFAQALIWATTADTSTTDLANIATVQEYLASSAFTAYQSQPYEIAGPRSAWHQQMHAEQAALGVNASDRALAQNRIQNMQNLVNAFLQAQANYNSAYEFWEAAIKRTCGGLFQRITPCTPQDPCPPTPPPSAACIAVRKEVPSATALEEASIALSQAVIEEYLMADRITGQVDHGCLGTTENKCDWTPDMITAEYLTTLDADMASDLAFCDSVIGKQAATVANQGYPKATTDEYYFGFGLHGIVATATSFEQSETWAPPTTEPNTIHKDMFGGPTNWSIGGSTAGANYQQDGYWELRGENNPSNGELCYLAGRAYAGALATVTLFGSPHTILDTDAQVAVGEKLLTQTSPMEAGAPETQADDVSGVGIESHLTVFGDTIFSVNQTQTGTLSYPIVSQQYSVTVLDVQGEIGPFSLDLQAQLQATINGTFTAVPPQKCTPASTEAQLGYALGINVTPTFSAVAVGTALVGAAGTGLGIQGKIDIISISTPVNVSSALDTGSNGTNMTLTETASVDMSVLGGELDAAECLLDQCATQQIFSWNGIPVMNDVIWNDTQTVPLPSLVYAFNAGL